jgi:hypothetical protein
MIVGSVFFVDVHIKLVLESSAKKYNHHHCLSNSKPGKMMAILVMKAQNSTAFTFVQ